MASLPEADLPANPTGTADLPTYFALYARLSWRYKGGGVGTLVACTPSDYCWA